MSAIEGIRVFGNKAISAIKNEYKQMDTPNVFQPLHYNSILSHHKPNIINAIDLIKEKSCGKIKGRAVADGRKQQNLYEKAEVAPPTLSLEGFINTLVIDASEERNIAIADVAGAF